MSKYLPIDKVVKSVSITHKFDKPILSFLNTSDVENGKVININRLPIEELKGQAKKTIKKDDILFSEIRPKNRRYAYIDFDDTYDYVVSTKLMVLRNINPEVDNRYFYYFLTNDFMLSILQDRAENRIGSFPQITFDLLSEYTIRVPNLAEQKSIASILSALDSKIALNNRINAELEAMAKTVYDYWFVQFDFPFDFAQGKPSAEGKPYKSSGGKMVWSEELKREVPEGWEVRNLFSAMDVQYGFPFSTEYFTDEVTLKPIVRIRDILENSVSTFTTEEVDDKYMLLKNDLIIGMDGNFHVNFWYKTGAYLNQRSVRIRSLKDSNISNLQTYFELRPYIKAKESSVSRTTVGHLSDKDLKGLYLLDSNSTSFKPKEFFDSILDKITTNRVENQQLSSLRDWLLPMLMNGQVKVGAAYEGEVESLMAAEPGVKYGVETKKANI